jgi:cell division protein FtsL
MSTFNIILILFAMGIAIVLYVNNILAVNQLVNNNHQLEVRLKEMQGVKEQLKAEVSKKSSLGRIGPIAREKLGLQSQEQPILFDVDTQRLERLK